MIKLDGVQVGDTVRYKYQGEWEYSRVVDGGHSPVDWSLVAPGTTVHQCVWKGDVLTSRRIFIMPDSPERADRLQWVVDQQRQWDSRRSAN